MQEKKWYPENSSDCCRRYSCKYHAPKYQSRLFPYGCDYCVISGESKTERPDYRRLSPPERGCTLYEAAPKGWHALRVQELRKQETHRAAATKKLSRLYQQGIFKDYTHKEE